MLTLLTCAFCLAPQVRLSWLFPLRALLFVGYAMFYQVVGLPHPWIQALAVHTGSFACSWAVDVRYRSVCVCASLW